MAFPCRVELSFADSSIAESHGQHPGQTLADVNRAQARELAAIRIDLKDG
jgi:hypothetical protein